MDSFPRFTRSKLFKDLLMQDLDGKQLPVLDITPAPIETTPVQDNDPAKIKVTRVNSTKVSQDISIINTLIIPLTVVKDTLCVTYACTSVPICHMLCSIFKILCHF